MGCCSSSSELPERTSEPPKETPTGTSEPPTGTPEPQPEPPVSVPVAPVTAVKGLTLLRRRNNPRPRITPKKSRRR